jgi:hypothetical protein
MIYGTLDLSNFSRSFVSGVLENWHITEGESKRLLVLIWIFGVDVIYYRIRIQKTFKYVIIYKSKLHRYKRIKHPTRFLTYSTK